MERSTAMAEAMKPPVDSTTSMPTKKRSVPPSEDGDASSKRQRTSPPATSQPAEATTDTAPKSSSTAPIRKRNIDERKRSQRLFGSLLGTVAQKPSDASQRRRAEIEERKREEAKKRELEIQERQAERLERIDKTRRLAQRKADEQDLKVRHASMKARAGFLLTETEPRLYYMPWELRPEDEARIVTQKAEVEVDIARELEEFDQRRKKWREDDERDGVIVIDQKGERESHESDALGGNGNHEHDPAMDSAGGDGEQLHDGNGRGEMHLDQIDQPIESEDKEFEQIGEVQKGPQAHDGKQQAEIGQQDERRTSVDDTGDVVVDNGEDAVIY